MRSTGPAPSGRWLARSAAASLAAPSPTGGPVARCWAPARARSPATPWRGAPSTAEDAGLAPAVAHVALGVADAHRDRGRVADRLANGRRQMAIAAGPDSGLDLAVRGVVRRAVGLGVCQTTHPNHHRHR